MIVVPCRILLGCKAISDFFDALSFLLKTDNLKRCKFSNRVAEGIQSNLRIYGTLLVSTATSAYQRHQVVQKLYFQRKQGTSSESSKQSVCEQDDELDELDEDNELDD
ncbi:MAG: hypothetical protein EZS28_005614 [Streblomastix strix]|uniref:Uncharacterized protein n=1 Tax=Streblomastix strix TaxID=222440 RepID=A0A5J4WX53_9EUKA|nr:MAG: hypothetical protein EZS28_005614 [Streblomastix strix]